MLNSIDNSQKTNLKTLLNSEKILPHYISAQNKNCNSLPPIAVEYHWCSTCNYNCVHCSYAQRRKSNQCLSQEVVSKSVGDLIKLGVKAVYLSGGGEPTTFKNWELYSQMLLEENIELALITNSILIQESNVEMLRKFNYIAVSIYSDEESQYKQITNSNQFKKQFALPKLLKIPDSNLIVGARCVINSINYKNIFKTYKKALDSGFDYVIFIPAVDYEKKKIDLTDEQKKYILEQIESNITKIDSTNTNLLNIKKNKIQHYQETYIDKFANKRGCDSISIRSNAFINYDGNVYLCQPLIGNIEYSIGNINKNDFKHIWNSSRHKEVIEKLNKKFEKGECENCRAIGYNLKINEFLNKKESINMPQDNFV